MRALTPPSVSVCFQCSIQRSAFDRCASLSQSGGAFPLASGPNLTLLVRQLLFFYRQSEDSKRLVSVGSAFSNPRVCVFQLLIHCGQTTPPAQLSCEPPRSVALGCLCDHVFSLLKLIQIFGRLFHFFLIREISSRRNWAALLCTRCVPWPGARCHPRATAFSVSLNPGALQGEALTSRASL